MIDQLPLVRAAVGPSIPLIYDSGVAWGLDVMRALAKGADFVMLGRAFQYAVAAFGKRGIDHLIHVLRADIMANMSQLGEERLDQISKHLLAAQKPFEPTIQLRKAAGSP